MHTNHRLQISTHSADQKLLRLHDALEHVGRLPEDDGVDVVVLEAGIEQRTVQGLTDQAGKSGFRMSFPRANPHEVAYEPWHWAWWG